LVLHRPRSAAATLRLGLPVLTGCRFWRSRRIVWFVLVAPLVAFCVGLGCTFTSPTRFVGSAWFSSPRGSATVYLPVPVLPQTRGCRAPPQVLACGCLLVGFVRARARAAVHLALRFAVFTVAPLCWLRWLRAVAAAVWLHVLPFCCTTCTGSLVLRYAHRRHAFHRSALLQVLGWILPRFGLVYLPFTHTHTHAHGSATAAMPWFHYPAVTFPLATPVPRSARRCHTFCCYAACCGSAVLPGYLSLPFSAMPPRRGALLACLLPVPRRHTVCPYLPYHYNTCAMLPPFPALRRVWTNTVTFASTHAAALPATVPQRFYADFAVRGLRGGSACMRACLRSPTTFAFY